MDWYLKVLQQYAVFTGRARRAEYWMFVLFNFIFAIVLLILDNVLELAIDGIGFGPLFILYILGMFIPGLAVTARRLHDVGKSGWMMLISLIPILGAIWLLVLTVTDSDPEPNQYGQNPKANSDETSFSNESVPAAAASNGSTRDTITVIVVVWMLISHLFYGMIAGQLYDTSWFNVLNMITSLIGSFIPLALAFTVENQTKRIILLVLGGLGLIPMLYEISKLVMGLDNSLVF
ncbi:DUF805 domain-containing protein [Reichenbachiella versicolor]|uniref:DUF805 domain-containing protein n=1 Tax=Reichenbachiella versicolor TaxID=1821036 RepID=UPI000D6E05BF|nr:DUF805 domain-containing protein [Reichenbachiella versicolor]